MTRSRRSSGPGTRPNGPSLLTSDTSGPGQWAPEVFSPSLRPFGHTRVQPTRDVTGPGPSGTFCGWTGPHGCHDRCVSSGAGLVGPTLSSSGRGGGWSPLAPVQ